VFFGSNLKEEQEEGKGTYGKASEQVTN